ncbi:hypothetical protein [Spirochaeta cellobiosiphila]|uniref:hypothetical protein n=1 Tax=Spirochaeta cellobiosiphila TaxID=504483 RepID=UPI001B7FE741|nr:hypothetical protein [Spirochaeta cellobiosiphila]
MNSNITHFLDFPENNKLYTEMSRKSVDLLFNIEMLYKNKNRLDFVYHEPDNFILECNNLIRNAIFLVEKANKSKTKYPWLKEFIDDFKQKYQNEFLLLKKIRDNSMHQEFLISEGTIEFGLFRIMSPIDYKLKIGMVDIKEEKNIDPQYLYSSTTSFFHKILFLHQYMFMDIKHIALNECLGVTRRWLCRIKYNDNNKKSKTEDIDIYDCISKFTSNLIVGISNAFKNEYSIDEEKIYFCHYPNKYNNINTILEIDFYPDFFCKQWVGNIKPLNLKFNYEHWVHEQYIERNNAYMKLVDNLPDDRGQLLEMMESYTDIQIEDFKEQDEYNRYTSFITFPHYYIKSILTIDTIFEIDFSLLLNLQTIGLKYIQEIDVKFDNVSDENINKYLQVLGIEIKKLHQNILDVFDSEDENRNK